jgi:hypothetical protein
MLAGCAEVGGGDISTGSLVFERYWFQTGQWSMELRVTVRSRKWIVEQ